MLALLPLKLLTAAKQRLGRVLDPDQRRTLTLAMAADVLTAVKDSRGVDQALIVSRNEEADELAERYDCGRFRESAQCDLPGALTEAIASLDRATKNAGVLVLPADLPLLLATDLDCVVSAHEALAVQASACTLVADQALMGTNALALSPADSMALIFDGASYRPHFKGAIEAGLLVQTLSLQHFALDIDTPEDLERLRELRPNSHTGRYLASL